MLDACKDGPALTAVDMMDGMMSTTVLSLCVIPALYALLEQWDVQRASRLAAIDQQVALPMLP